jgi:hypothetical protein
MTAEELEAIEPVPDSGPEAQAWFEARQADATSQT